MMCDVGADQYLAEGGMRIVEAGGQKILLTKVGGRCHAVGATCPHAGAPLSEGVLQGKTIICPWHKAAFDVTTGRRTAPPAVDDLLSFAVQRADGRLLLDIRAPQHATGSPFVADARDGRCMAIVGAGAAGAVAAQTLREAGFRGRVVLIGLEDRLPYDRTVLSKYALSGKQGGEKTPLQDQSFYDRYAIERVSRRVVSIEPARRTITFENGSTLIYHAALAATGGSPRKLDVPGRDLPGLFVLRSAADAEAIAAAAAGARSAVIAGAGFIAMEAAASLRERGLHVTVVAAGSVPFERRLGREIGQVFRRVHEREGIEFRLQDEIVALEGKHRIEGVRLKSGGHVPADLVVTGLGISPETLLLGDVSRAPDGGVLVDAGLRATDGLYAAGDIAAFPLLGDGGHTRVEHWRVAEQHGRVAALNMLGCAIIYDAVPYFWTIHFMKRLDYIGHAEQWDDILLDGDLEEPRFTACYVKDGEILAVAGWGEDRKMAAALGRMSERRGWSAADKERLLF